MFFFFFINYNELFHIFSTNITWSWSCGFCCGSRWLGFFGWLFLHFMTRLLWLWLCLSCLAFCFRWCLWMWLRLDLGLFCCFSELMLIYVVNLRIRKNFEQTYWIWFCNSIGWGWVRLKQLIWSSGMEKLGLPLLSASKMFRNDSNSFFLMSSEGWS